MWWEWKCGWCVCVHSGIMAASEQVDHHKTKQLKWDQSKEKKNKKINFTQCLISYGLQRLELGDEHDKILRRMI